MPRCNKNGEEARKPVHSPGGLFPTGLFFEQIEGGKYVQWNAEGKGFVRQLSINYDEVYVPLRRVPWMLCQEPKECGDLSDLWQEIYDFIYEHLFLPDKNLYDVLTAWVVATWTTELWPYIPYIFFMGPVSSGKTRGLEVLHRLSYRAIISSNISTAALFRVCQQWHPTIILDECEIYNKTERGEIIGLLNSGYRRGQCAIRAKNTEQGTELETFDVFGFKALAGTQTLRATLESRCILIPMIKSRRKVRLSLDEKRAHDIRCRLLMYRMRALRFETTKENLGTPIEAQLAERSEQLLAKVPPLHFADGRLQELFRCLLAVGNHGKESIITYAKKMAEAKLFEELATVEAELVNIIVALASEQNVVLTKELAEKFNENRSEREKWKSSSLGRIMRRLGFQRRHTHAGNGWLVDKDRLQYLSQIYGEGGDLLEEGSEGSQDSPSHPLTVHAPEPREPSEPLDTPKLTIQETVEKVRPYIPTCFEEETLVRQIVSLGFSRDEAEKRVKFFIDKEMLGRDDVGLWHWTLR